MTTQGLEKVTADIERMFSKFNIQSLENIRNRLPSNKILEMGWIIAHRDFDKLLDFYNTGKKFAVVSGRGPSGPIHLGHLYLFKVVKFLQDTYGAEVFIPLSDDEKFVFGKLKSLDDGEYWALDNARIILSLGFNEKRTTVYVSSRQNWVYRYALLFARKLTINTVKSAFGIDDSSNVGIPFYAAVQIAHILQPTIDLGLPVVVPIGLDQDVYMRLARDVSERLDLTKPASIYVRFIRGLTGEPMSSSIPETAIYVNDTDEEIRRKIMNAFTGGQPSIEEHRRFGGKPEKCVIFEWLKAFVFNSMKEAEKHAELCRRGEIVCGFDCKNLLARRIIDLVHEVRIKASKVDLSKYMKDDKYVGESI